MRNRTIACVTVGLALAAGIALSQPATGSGNEADAVTKQCQAFKLAWNGHDPKALAAVFAEDADHIDPWGQLDTGRPAIQKMLTERMTGQGPLRDSSLVVNAEVVRFPTDGTAVTDAEATLSGAYGPDGSKAPPMELHVTNVWKKINGNWMVYACRPYLKPAAK